MCKVLGSSSSTGRKKGREREEIEQLGKSFLRNRWMKWGTETCACLENSFFRKKQSEIHWGRGMLGAFKGRWELWVERERWEATRWESQPGPVATAGDGTMHPCCRMKGCAQTHWVPEDNLCFARAKGGNEPGRQDEQGQPSGGMWEYCPRRGEAMKLLRKKQIQNRIDK